MNLIPEPNPLSNAPIYYLPSTTSTMEIAKNLLTPDAIVAGDIHGTAIIAGYQTSGRGRVKERTWVSEPDENLLCSLILDTEKVRVNPSFVPILIGLAVCDFLQRDMGITAEIKWPNDILVNRKKICGILCELKVRWIIAGFGLNVGQVTFPQDLRNPACSITSVLGSAPSAQDCYFGISSALASRLTLADKKTPKEHVLVDIRKKLFGLGRNISVSADSSHDGTRIAGTLCGIGDNGQLLVKKRTGVVVECYGGEISFLEA